MTHLEQIAEESAAFRRAVTGDLQARVPSCPDWQVGDLVAHLGAVQRFHALHVVRGVTSPPTERPTVPEDDGALLDWFDEGTRLLLAALDRDLDGPAWNWAPHTPQTVRFWPRRMALEAAVHRWDAESARRDARGFDVELAVDGIDEVLTVHHETPPADVLVRLTDHDRTWRTGPGDEKTPAAVLEGTATGVFLALWGRVPLSSLTTEGDESQVAALRTG